MDALELRNYVMCMELSKLGLSVLNLNYKYTQIHGVN